MLVLLYTTAQAQYLEFVQNKGQWDNNIQFKGDFTTGAVALKPDGGYRVMLYNASDLNNITQRIHQEQKPATIHKVTNPKGVEVNEGYYTTGSNILHGHIYEVKFLNANPHPVAVTEKRLTRYNNYFIGNDSSKWASRCAVYTSIIYKNIYPNIDVHYYTNNGAFKYDIIVNPGGDPTKVAFSIDGATSLALKSGNLIIRTTVDTVKELQPYSYQVTKQGNQPVKFRFNLSGNVVRFTTTDKIAAGTTLVIDPTVIFSSFSGSRADNWGYTATYDNAGAFYAGGTVFAQGFRVSNGAYQSQFAGGNNSTGEGNQGVDLNGFDMGIMKFNSQGNTVLYATYIGGKQGNEQPHSLVTDAAGNLIIAGRTNSTDYPTAGIGKIGPCGGQDIILTKLSPNGDALPASLRIGGTGKDGVNMEEKDLAFVDPTAHVGTYSIRRNYGDDARSEVILDAQNNIYLAACTQSSDFPIVNGFQTILQGKQDAIVLKFSADLNSQPVFSTYLGGSGNDAAFVLKIDPLNGNIYAGGATSSNNFPGTSGVSGSPISGTYLGGDCDGFVSILSNDGKTLVKSIYFGTSSADQVYGIDFGKNGNPFITGTSEGRVPTSNSPFNSNNNQAAGNQFITKLQPSLNGIVYSANFGPGGDKPNISPTAFLVDICENVYVSGWGGKLDGDYANAGVAGLTYKSPTPVTLPLRQSAFVYGGFYFFVLEKNASSQLFGAFVSDPEDGGMHVDGGTSRFDKDGIIYQAVCACGTDRELPTTGAAYTTNGAAASRDGFACNLTSIKIAFELSGVRSSIRSSIKNISNDTVGCIPLTVKFTDTIGNAKKYIWRFGDGSKDTSTTTATVSHTYTQVGVYTIRLIGIDSSTCNIADTSYITIHVRNDPAKLGLDYQRLEPCESLNYQFTNLSTPTAGKPFKSNSFLWNFGDGSTLIAGNETVTHKYTSPGSYTIVLNLTDTNYCNAPDADSVHITIALNVAAAITQPAAGCAPYTVQFNNTTTGGQTYQWSFGDGGSSTGIAPTHTFVSPGVYTVTLIAYNTESCNKADTTTVTVTVSGKPTAAFSFTPVPAQENTPATFFNSSQNATHYRWDFGDGTTLNTVSIDTTVTHIYDKTGTYNTCLVAYNDAGCTDTICHAVPALIKPLVDVPNAFTPNGDGQNDQIHIKGYGIAKVTWNIYNRWGQLVFTTNDKNQGWDGLYKGVLQPQEVYMYTLDVQFGDGSIYRKTGDITLLR